MFIITKPPKAKGTVEEPKLHQNEETLSSVLWPTVCEDDSSVTGQRSDWIKNSESEYYPAVWLKMGLRPVWR